MKGSLAAAAAVCTETAGDPAGAERPRLVICSAGVPDEKNGASTVLFYHYVARLKQEGYRILHLLLLEGDAWPAETIEAYRHKMDEPGHFDVATCRSSRFVEEGRTAHRLDERAATEARALLEAFAPDVILAFDMIAAWIAQPIRAPRVVWLGDLRFETVWFHALYASRERLENALHLPSNWLSCRTWKRLYAEVLGGAERVLVASRSSVAQLAPLGIEATYEPYPWPEEVRGDFAARPSSSSRPTFLFFGTLTGLGSRSALHFTLERVFPRLRRLWGEGGFRIFLAGRGTIPAWAERLMAGKPEFEQLGFIEDLDSLMSSCHAVLVPIDVPVGNRSRIITAWAKRTLVIAHANTALGNPALVDNETCYLAADPDQFVERMRLAVADSAGASRIVQRGFECWYAQFRPEAAGERMAALVKRTLTHARLNAPNALMRSA